MAGLAPYTVKTDKNGIARLDSWSIGPESGVYSVYATVANGARVTFTTFVRSATLATYLLTAPAERAGGSRIYLFDDGSWISGGSTPPDSHEIPSGQYAMNGDATIDFTKLTGVAFARGTLTGNDMKMVYTDYVDFDDEVYTRVEAPAPASVNYKVVAVGQLQRVAVAGENVDPLILPAVRVAYPNNLPAAGVSVTFDGSVGGNHPVYSVNTDATGIARLDAWRIGSKAGDYSIAVLINQTLYLKFVTSVLPTISAEFDLSEALPDMNLDIGGAHYIFYSDGRFSHYYGASGDESSHPPMGTYVFTDSATVQFSTPYGPYSTGKLTGNILNVSYFDPVDFDNEVYVRR
jgi:hypothetical protein